MILHSGAEPVRLIDTTDLVPLYENNFDGENPLKDFKAFRGTWEVRDGKVYLTALKAGSQSFLLYDGDEKLCTLSDYVVDVDMYNIQSQGGALIRCDLDLVTDRTDNSFYGYIGFISFDGTLGAVGYGNASGDYGGNIVVSKGITKIGQDVHLQIAVRDDQIQYTVSDLATGKELYTWSGRHSAWTDGSFGFKLHAAPYSGTGACALNTTAFDNLVVSGYADKIGETELKMTVGSRTAYVNGAEKTLDAEPIIRQNRTMLPVRFVAENLGASVTWDGAASTAVVTGDGVVMELTIGAAAAKVNGKTVTLDAPAFIENSRTYLPVRFVAENLGAAVTWDGATSTATLTKGTPKTDFGALFETVRGAFKTTTADGSRFKSEVAGSLALAKDKKQTAGTVSACMIRPDSGATSIVFGYTGGDKPTYYKLSLTSNKYFALYKVSGNGSALLKQTALFAYSTTAAAEVCAVYADGHIYGYLDGMCLIDCVDLRPLTGDGVGVQTDTAGSLFVDFCTADTVRPVKADIVLWGHSHMQNWITYADDLSGYGTVVKSGIGGSVTTSWLNMTDELLSYDAKVMIVMIGTNDYKSTAESTFDNTKTILDTLHEKDPDLKIVLITEWLGKARLDYADFIHTLNQSYRYYAASHDFVTIVEGYHITLNADGSLKTDVFADNLHLNANGYSILKGMVRTALDNLLK